MTAARRVPHNGCELTLRELAEATGHTYACLCGRYGKGDRGEKLIRPLDCVGKNSARTPQSLRGEGADVNTRKAEAAKREAQLERDRERAVRMAALRAEHARVMAAPLIDSSLLTDAEHAASWKRVNYCGQRNWRTKGLA